MTILIIIFGALTLLAGIVIVINPEVIFGFLRNNLDKLAIHILAVVVRLLIGALLIYQSNISKFPFVIEVIGWLSIVAARVGDVHQFISSQGTSNRRMGEQTLIIDFIYISNDGHDWPKNYFQNV